VLGVLEGIDVVEAPFAREAILQRAPQALDAPLGLGRVRRDVADAEVLEHGAQVGRMLGALQLFLEGPVAIVADEDVDAIAIGREGQAVAGEDLPEHLGIAVQVFGGAEGQPQDRAGGVVVIGNAKLPT
jgi:hypothetical protein